MSTVLAIVFWRRRSVFASCVSPSVVSFEPESPLMSLRSVNRILRVAILYTMETSLVTAYVLRPRLQMSETKSEQDRLDGRSCHGKHQHCTAFRRTES